MLYYIVVCRFFFFKQKTAYEMRISDWSSDVCSSDLTVEIDKHAFLGAVAILQHCVEAGCAYVDKIFVHQLHDLEETLGIPPLLIHEFVDLILRNTKIDVESPDMQIFLQCPIFDLRILRSDEHTSELQSLMRTSYAVFCLKKKN